MALLHIDIDAFFASAEQVLDPALMGRPVVVGGLADDRSVVASASYEARALGVRVAMPLAQAARVCPQAVFLRGQYRAYRAMAEKLLDCCRDVSPRVEPASIDEAYLDLAGCERLYGIGSSALAVAEGLRDRVKRATGLSVSIGIGANKLIAKIASGHAKPAGILEIRAGYEADFLRCLPVRCLPGIGPRAAQALDRYNLHTVADLARLARRSLVDVLGHVGEAVYGYVRGQDPSAVRTDVRPKSVSRETTFEQDTADRAQVRAMLHYLIERACRQLREQRLWARTLSVKLRYSDFDTVSMGRRVRTPSNHDRDFYGLAVTLLDRLYKRRVQVRLVGVCLAELVDETAWQMNFLEELPREKRVGLYRGIDDVRDRFGFGALVVGPSIGLMDRLEKTPDGFQLRTSCLSR